MSHRGIYKYICDECGAENWLSAQDRSSRFKSRCISCGSTWLEPSKRSTGPTKLSKAHQAAKESIRRMNDKMGKK